MKSLPRPSMLEKLVNLPSDQVRQPVPGPNPQTAVVIRVQRADEIVGQTVGRSKSLDLSLVEQVQAVRGADPEIVAGAPGQRKNDVAGKPFCGGVVGKASAGAPVQSRPVGANPQLAFAALKDAAHESCRKAHPPWCKS